MYHILYRLTNKINGKYYIGIHSSDSNVIDFDDGYRGSGILINLAKEKHGKHNFERTVLASFDNRDDACNAEIETLKDCLNDSLCYNLAPGGDGNSLGLNSIAVWKKRDPKAYEDWRRTIGQKIVQSRHKNGHSYKELIYNLKRAESKLARLYREIKYPLNSVKYQRQLKTVEHYRKKYQEKFFYRYMQDFLNQTWRPLGRYFA